MGNELKNKIVALGDSLTLGFPFEENKSWPGILREEKGLNIINKGINGDTTKGMFVRFDWDVVKLSPDVVVITGGANDILNGIPLEQIKENILKMITTAKNHKIIPVLGITPPVDDPMLQRKLKKFVDFLNNLSSDYLLIDFYSSMIDKKTNKLRTEYDLDGVHPNERGYRTMAETAWDILKKYKRRGV